MATKIIYIKGYFRGKYSGPLDNSSTGTQSSYPMEFYESHIEDAETIEEYHSRYLSYKPYIERSSLPNTTIQFKGINKNNLFQEDLKNALINNIRISNVIKSGSKSYGNVEGDIYATYEYWEPEKTTESTSDETIEPDNNDLEYDSSEDNFIATKPKEKTKVTNQQITQENKINDFVKRVETTKGNFWTMLVSLGILWFIISLFGFNWFTVSCIGFYLAAFLSEIIAPLFGWTEVPTSAHNDMVWGIHKWLRQLFSFLLIALAIVCYFIGLKLFTWILLVIFILSIWCYSTQGIYHLRRIWQLLGILMIIGVSLVLSNLYLSDLLPNPLKTDNGDTTVPPIEIKDSTGKTQQLKYAYDWKDYAKNIYHGSYSMLKNDFDNSSSNRNKIDESNDFGNVYNSIWQNDKLLMPSLYKMLDSIRTSKNLNQQQFADVAVSFVQYIPYVLVHDLTCSEIVNNNLNNDFIQSYHREGKECLQQIKFGVQAPAEFSFNNKGDCDTRAIVLFTILDHFNYDVAMLVSEEYGHCILGVNMPGTGTYKSHFGKRYYVWETTAKDFQLGQLPPEISNMQNWRIVLTSNQ